MVPKAPARIILLIALIVAKNYNWTHLRLGRLNSLYNYLCGAIVTNLLPRKKHFI